MLKNQFSFTKRLFKQCIRNYAKKIMVAHDGSKHAERALEKAIEYYKPGDQITILRVLAPSPRLSTWDGIGYTPEDDKIMHKKKQEFEQFLEMKTKNLREQGINCEGKIEIGEVRPLILKKAKELGIDLIVLGSHGLSLVERMVSPEHPELGSVCSYIVSKSKCDVLVIKPH